MKLYHGSNTKVEKIDLSLCRPYKDFGQGFYLTDIRDQAFNMADNTMRLYGGKPIVSVFEFDKNVLDENEVSVRKFEETPTINWAKFICNNRLRDLDNIDNADCNRDNRYDIVYGPVANDKIAVSLRLYINHFITSNELKKRLTFRDITNQYSFHTKKAVSFLKFVGVEYER